MKFPLFDSMNKSLAARLLVFTICVAAMAMSVSAQRLWKTAQELDTSFAPEAIGIDIEQCANGPASAPIPCNTSGANEGYVRGNVNESKSHYVEGQSVPIRFIASGLTVGEIYTVTLGYDYTKSGKYAVDYLTSYNRTESVNNNPCVNVTGCDLADVEVFGIPVDPEVTAGFDETPATGDDIVQIGGNFSIFGGTITAVSGYTRSGDQSGDSSKSFTITFEADETTVVIAYGAHISTRVDWGINNSAIAINGSPYHNFVVDFPGANGGSRDLQLAASAVVFPAQVTIVKCVTTIGAPPGTTSTFEFDFTSSANFGMTGFTLVDDVTNCASGGTGSITASNLTAFGAINAITVQEADYGPNWTLAGLVCVENPGGVPQTDNSTTNLGTRTATIILEEGEFVTCTFSNTQLTPTAAPASVSGRVTDSFGRGVSSARLTITDAQTGQSWSALSNPFGYYTIEGPEVGNFYMLQVSHKRYTFADSTRMFSLNEDLVGMDFVANP